MAFEIKTQTLYYGLGTNCTFTFSDTIQQYVVGLSGFGLNYSQNQGLEFSVMTMSISLDVVGVSGNTLTIFPNLTLLSGNGNFLAAGGFSWVTVTVLAWTGSVNNDQLILATNIQNEQLSLPSTPLTIQPVLSGFNLNFGMYPANLEMVNISTGVSQAVTGIQCYGTGSMYSGDIFPYIGPTSTTAGSPWTNYGVCNTGTVNTGLIVNCDPTLNLSCVNYLNNGNNTTVSLSSAVRSTIMTGFSTILGGNNTIAAIAAQTQLDPSNNSVNISSYIASSGASSGATSSGSANFVTIDY